ncbi:hypothetical protein FITA111629_11395 [Filibacter tadaridae]|uniref:Uncharacterized protein n=1 Tax=Filibacter tadaridae TaxID=2483811 RepID=A0A3P5X9X9_9BACL|nr:hypothetical protein [Filibacter tadaridae]VDC25179.1 hypothetical protein FILTAD_01204 [Filibacter tadaridae]
MKVDISRPNSALLSLIDDYLQVLPIDANLLIPSDRSKVLGDSAVLDLETYKKFWLNPLFLTFPYLAIHQAVYEEVTVKPELFKLINEKIDQQALLILNDEELTTEEKAIRQSVEYKIAASTNYEPEIDNKDDRGEVKSLAYIHVKDLIYFCSNDSNALRLVEHAEKLDTNLDSLITIKLYEIIYYLYIMKMAELKHMRFMYKFHYLSTTNEKKINPSWNDFKIGMDAIYNLAVANSTGKPTPILE